MAVSTWHCDSLRCLLIFFFRIFRIFPRTGQDNDWDNRTSEIEWKGKRNIIEGGKEKERAFQLHQLKRLTTTDKQTLRFWRYNRDLSFSSICNHINVIHLQQPRTVNDAIVYVYFRERKKELPCFFLWLYRTSSRNCSDMTSVNIAIFVAFTYDINVLNVR